MGYNEIECSVIDCLINRKAIDENLLDKLINYLCERYGYNEEKLATKISGFDKIEGRPINYEIKNNSLLTKYLISMALNEHDIFSIGVLLFNVDVPSYNGYEYVINDKPLLKKLIDILEAIDLDGFGCFILAEAYYRARGCHKDTFSAMMYYEKSYQLGFLASNVCFVYLKNKNMLYDVAYDYYKNNNDSYFAKYYLMLAYFYGYGVDIDYNKALDLFDKNGLDMKDDRLKCQYYLKMRYITGVCYYRGLGVKASYNDANALFRFAIASDLYDVKYCYAISMMANKNDYFDYSYAFKLLKSSAEGEYPPAIRKLAMCYKLGYGTIKSDENYKKCIDFYKYLDKTNSLLGHDADFCSFVKCNKVYIDRRNYNVEIYYEQKDEEDNNL